MYLFICFFEVCFCRCVFFVCSVAPTWTAFLSIWCIWWMYIDVILNESFRESTRVPLFCEHYGKLDSPFYRYSDIWHPYPPPPTPPINTVRGQLLWIWNSLSVLSVTEGIESWSQSGFPLKPIDCGRIRTNLLQLSVILAVIIDPAFNPKISNHIRFFNVLACLTFHFHIYWCSVKVFQHFW